MKKVIFILSFFIFLFCFQLFGYFGYERVEMGTIRVVFFDIGQGDSALISTPDGKHILVDGGPDNSVVYKLGQYLPWWEREIDIVILSHPDSDHLMGLVEVLQRYKVLHVITSGVLHNTDEYAEWKKALTTRGISIFSSNEISNMSIEPNLKLVIFYPKEDLRDKNVEKINNTSIVAKVTYGKTSFLFTGDLEADKEEEILDSGMRSEILKFPHHGSSDSLSKAFLESVDPQLAIISVGENTFGHPSARTLRLLERLGIKTLVTREVGDIVVTTNGETFAY